MKKLFVIITLWLHTVFMNAQQLSILQDDTTICLGGSFLLQSSFTPLSVTTYPLCPVNCDDYISANWIPLGFNFEFYGNTFNQCLVTDNNYILFTGTPGGTSAGYVTVNLPDISGPKNAIMMPWQDLYYYTDSSLIRYTTVGVAPNRIFVLEHTRLMGFACGFACNGGQVHLYEGSNRIETHIIRRNVCPMWNAGKGVHGIQNATGTIAHIVPGRNATSPAWTIIGGDGYRWTPAGPGNYTMAPIPCRPFYLDATIAPSSIKWFYMGSPIGTGTSIYVTPTADTSLYTCVISKGCSPTAYYSTDSVKFIANHAIANIDSLIISDDSICTNDDVDLFLTGYTGALTWEQNTGAGWTTLSFSTDSIHLSALSPGNYQFRARANVCSTTFDTSDVVSLYVSPLPDAGTISSAPAVYDIHLGDTVYLYADSSIGYIEWSVIDPGDSLSFISNNDSCFYLVADTGIYHFFLVATNGICSNDTSVMINYNSHGLAMVAFNIPGHIDTLAVSDPPVILSGGAPGGGIYAGPGVSAGIFDPAIASIGLHTITYTYDDGFGFSASASDHIFVYDNIGINEAANSTVQFYPNPSDGYYHALVQAEGEMILKVYDVLGHVIYTRQQKIPAHYIMELDLTDQPQGIYLADFTLNNNRYSYKLVKK